MLAVAPGISSTHVGTAALGCPPGETGSAASIVYLSSVVTQNPTIVHFFSMAPRDGWRPLLNAGAEKATHAALVCHPHPLFGGTLHNKVCSTHEALNSFGFPVLRFNFARGLSQGGHDEGKEEVDDVRAALDWLDAEFHLPLYLPGFSFGAAVGLKAACPDSRVKGRSASEFRPDQWLPARKCLAPTNWISFRDCAKPKLFVSGARDQFGPRAKVEALVASLPEPKKLVLIEGADHFSRDVCGSCARQSRRGREELSALSHQL